MLAWLRGLRERPARATAAAYVVGLLVTMYVAHVHRNFIFDYDARFWFLGGVMWLRGDSPYAHGPFVQTWIHQFNEPPVFPAGFVYPGTILPLSLLLGSFEWDVARWVMRGLNFAAYAGTLVVLRQVLVSHRDDAVPASRREFWVGVAAVTPGAAFTMYQGQVSLLVTLGIVLTWAGLLRGRTAYVVAGLLLAGIKPQVSVVPLLFLATRFWDRRLWWGIGAAASVGSLAFLWSSPLQCLADLGGSLDEHARQDFNNFGRYDNLPALFGGTPLGPAALCGGMLVACAAAVALGAWSRRREIPGCDLRLFQVVLVAAAALMPIHRYDLVIYMPLLATAWALGSSWRGAVLVMLVVGHGMASWIALKIVRPAVTPGTPWMEYMDLASRIATAFVSAELIFLLACWFRDRRWNVRPGGACVATDGAADDRGPAGSDRPSTDGPGAATPDSARIASPLVEFDAPRDR